MGVLRYYSDVHSLGSVHHYQLLSGHISFMFGYPITGRRELVNTFGETISTMLLVDIVQTCE